MMGFKKGDIVRLRNGQLPLMIFHIDGYKDRVSAVYLHETKDPKSENQSTGVKRGTSSRFVHYDGPIPHPVKSQPTNYTKDFKVGDIVRLRNGRLPLRILSISPPRNRIKALYLHRKREYSLYESGTKTGFPSQFVMYENHQPEEDQKMENSTQLYTWTVNETQNFGVRIGTTRDGKAVMEMKGTGKIELIAPSDLEEVLPYTVHVRSLYENGISKHIIIEDTEFLEVGDVIAVPRGGLFQVIELDTKNKRALPFESYRKVLMVEPKK